MKEKIENKIDEIIEYILAKDPREITYAEYKILDSRSRDLTFREEQEKRNQEARQRSEDMAKALAHAMDYTPISSPVYLPEPKIEEV